LKLAVDSYRTQSLDAHGVLGMGGTTSPHRRLRTRRLVLTGALVMATKLSTYHRTNHAASLALARRLRGDGSAHGCDIRLK
jgi:hypothetical protein